MTITISAAYDRLRAALAMLRADNDEERAVAMEEIDAAIHEGASAPAADWRDVQRKAEMLRVAASGRNAGAAREILSAIAVDLDRIT